MQIQILNGIYTDDVGEFRTSYPRNLIPVPKDQGISKGYLNPADGIHLFGTGPGIGRGGIRWNNECYRSMGSKLVKIDVNGVATTLGEIGDGGQCSIDYSFDRLAISSNGKLFYWNGSTLTQVTDPDLGIVVDFIFIDGYFLITDGTYLIVTELSDPNSINPLKYGSAESDPDSIKGVLKLHNEPYAIGRYTIEAFENVGGSLFPYNRIKGALINKGAIGTHAATIYKEAIAFVGGGRNETPAVYLGKNASAIKISTREIDQILSEYSETELSSIFIETRLDKNHAHLLVHLSDKTLVYDDNASQLLGQLVWFVLDSGVLTSKQYRARNLVWCYDKWLVDDPTSSNHGFFRDDISTHYNYSVGWEFNTQILYNNGKGGILHDMELVALPGRIPLGADPYVWTSYTLDGETWSNERYIAAGKQGQRDKRLVWFQQGAMNNWRIQKFRGNSAAHFPVARLEGNLEPLYA